MPGSLTTSSTTPQPPSPSVPHTTHLVPGTLVPLASAVASIDTGGPLGAASGLHGRMVAPDRVSAEMGTAPESGGRLKAQRYAAAAAPGPPSPCAFRWRRPRRRR